MATILVVDDRSSNRDYLATLLGYHGHRVLEAGDGAEALSVARAERPELVITDVLMPGTSGCEFALQLRADPTLAGTRVIFYTATYPEQEARSLASLFGADYHLHKPAEPEEILEVVASMLGGQPLAPAVPPPEHLSKAHQRLLAEKLTRKVEALERETAERRRAEEALRVRARQQTAIAELGQTALTAKVPELLRQAVVRVPAVLEVELSAVLELLTGRSELLLRAGSGWRDGLVGRATVQSGAGSPAGYTLASARPVVVQNLGTEQRFRFPALLVEHGVVSGFSVLIGQPWQPWGVLEVYSTRQRDFTTDDISFLQSVANVLAQALARQKTDEALQASEQRSRTQLVELEQLYRTAPIGLCLMDRELRFLRINDRLAAINGRPVAAHMGRTLREVIPDIAAEVEATYRRVFASGEPVLDVELHGVTPAEPGVERDWVCRYLPIKDADGTVTAVSVVVLEITERKASENALRRSQRSLEQAQTQAQLGSWEYRPAERRVWWSSEMYRLFACDSTLGPPTLEEFLERIHPKDRHALVGVLTATHRKGGTATVEFRSNPAHGPIRYFLGTIDRAATNGVSQLQGTVQNVTDLRQAERQVREYSERLAVLSRQLLEIQENERRHLARELHDELGQVLTLIKMNVQAAQRAPEEEGSRSLDAAVAMVHQAISQVRSLSLDLRPSILDDFGLGAALEWYADRCTQAGQAVVVVEGSLGEERFAPAVETACFRVVQEAITNALRHAQAHEVRVAVERTPTALRVAVCDNGKGFDVGPASSRASQGGGTGLLGMEERVRLLGGQLVITSAPERGTEVLASFPLVPTLAEPGKPSSPFIRQENGVSAGVRPHDETPPGTAGG